MHDVGFEELVAEAESAPLEGWEFSFLEGRATEERPSWAYARTLVARAGSADALLDVQTGGGEVLAEVLAEVSAQPLGGRRPATVAATESFSPNVDLARRHLAPFGVDVAEVADDAALPFADGTFDLVVSRHPTVVIWDEIARVLEAGGAYLSQQVGPGANRALTDYLMGEQPVNPRRSPERAVAEATAAGLVVVDLRVENPQLVFHDIGAVVYFLRKVPWTVPGFTVTAYRDRLARLHARLRSEGPFISHAPRFLIEARKPG